MRREGRSRGGGALRHYFTRRNGCREVREHLLHHGRDPGAGFLRIAGDGGGGDGTPDDPVLAGVHEVHDQSPREVTIDRDPSGVLPVSPVTALHLKLFPGGSMIGDVQVRFGLVRENPSNRKLVLDGFDEDLVHLGVDGRRSLDPAEALKSREIHLPVPLNADGLGLGGGPGQRHREGDGGDDPYHAFIIGFSGSSRR
jgi:hypothetical protein